MRTPSLSHSPSLCVILGLVIRKRKKIASLGASELVCLALERDRDTRKLVYRCTSLVFVPFVSCHNPA